MYIILSFIIPVVTILVLILFFRHKVTFWEYIILFVPSIIIALIMNFSMISYNTSKTEYLGFHITHIKHFDAWDEYIHQTCTREVPCGTDSEGNTTYSIESYDCSYVSYHSEYWVMIDNCGNDHEITKAQFTTLRHKWKTLMQFIDMHRSYHTIDGDCQRYDWDRKMENSVNITTQHSYINKVQASQSIFNLEKITKEEVREYCLHDYPKVIRHKDGGYNQPSIIGKNFAEGDIKSLDYVNGFLGKSSQFRVYLLCYYDSTGIQTAMKQRSYWLGGNKNEFNICVGLDSGSNKINWVQTFSWTDDKNLSIEVENYLLNVDTLKVQELSKNLLRWVPQYWKRKEFKDFDYIRVTITTKQLFWICGVLLLLNIVGAVIVVLNEVEPKFMGRYKNNYKWN